VLVTLLRHGAVDGPAQVWRSVGDPPLSAYGRAQMQRREPVLTSPVPCAVWSSPLARCRDFAQAFALAQGVDCIVDPALREADFGNWEGRAWSEVAATDAAALAAFEGDPWACGAPAGESLAQVAARAAAFVEPGLDTWSRSAAATADPAHIVIVTHGGVLRALAGRWLSVTAGPALRLALPPAALLRFSWLTGQPPWLLRLDGEEAVR
jgi:broad specificity phosphatase PhoE